MWILGEIEFKLPLEYKYYYKALMCLNDSRGFIIA